MGGLFGVTGNSNPIVDPGSGTGIASPSSIQADQAPADVVGNPLTDPFFGSQMMGGQQGPPGVPSYPWNQPDQGGGDFPQTPQGDISRQNQQNQQQNQQNSPLKTAATELKNIGKLLGGNQQPQSAAWIQPQQAQGPQNPSQGNAQLAIQPGGQPPGSPGIPQTPQTPAAAAIPLPRRRPDEAPSTPASAPAAAAGAQPTPAQPEQQYAQPNVTAPDPSGLDTGFVAQMQSGAGTPALNLAQTQYAASRQQPGWLQTTLQQVADQIKNSPAYVLSDPMHPPEASSSGAASGAASGSPATGEAPARFNVNSYIDTLFRIESGGDPYQQTHGNRGLAQFGRAEERMYGINDANRHDPKAVISALHREYEHHKGILRNSLGREPEPWESYFMHQQGLGGGPALLRADSDTPAWQVLRRFYPSDYVAQSAIGGNVLSTHPLSRVPASQITVGQFRAMWRDRFNRSYYAGSQ